MGKQPRDASGVRGAVDELRLRLGPRYTVSEIEAQVISAARDLAGSVSSESLAEMAVRLAEFRLNKARAHSA
jgi:hypothetical protein